MLWTFIKANIEPLLLAASVGAELVLGGRTRAQIQARKISGANAVPIPPLVPQLS